MEDLKSMLNKVTKSLESEFKKLETKVNKLMITTERMEIEDLLKTMAWSMDSGDKETWLSVWSDDIHYTVPQYDIEIKGKKAVEEFAEAAIFTREEKRFSSLTNMVIEVEGNVATGKDYYMHYGYPIDPETGKASDERALSEGMHFYKFCKLNGSWKITHFEVFLNRRQEAEA